MTSAFRSMGCEIVVAGAAPGELAAIQRLFAVRDAVFSRFREDSEVSRVNAATGTALTVSPVFADALRRALWAADVTAGLVVPTLGGALEAAGYDRDFAELAPTEEPAGVAAVADWRAVRLYGRLLVRPRGLRLDLNGVVKALAVDEACAVLSGPGFVSAGGDLAVRSPLDVSLPAGGAVRLVRGGLATSGRSRRRWLRGGVVQHHLIDPATGRPAASPWSEVTVAGGSCLHADVAAKAAFLLGQGGPGWLAARGLPGRFVGAGGCVVENEAWAQRLGGTAACT